MAQKPIERQSSDAFETAWFGKKRGPRHDFKLTIGEPFRHLPVQLKGRHIQ